MTNSTNDRVTASNADQDHDEASRDQKESHEPEPAEDDYKRDESNRGERPDNLRRRSEWFEKRTGGR
jgi:hypothetical protein